VIFRFSILFLLLSAIPSVALTQLVTGTNTSPSGLVQNVLLGQGVTVSNIMYNGSPTAIGTFSATGTNLGINQGVVMTTGTVINNGNGPHGPNNQAGAGVDNNVGGSTLLTGLVTGAQTFNAAILEFDFVPFSDTVRFKYVFGSDEYPEFAPPNNLGYNDVFGFFISGPGISGIQNIARLPNNGSIVSINNVNAITNSQFFNYNGDGNTGPYNSNASYIQYDGFTDVLTAMSKVQCGKTYHLIIAVADVGDGQWDSGIFLEANSLSSKNPITIKYDLSAKLFSNPDWMAEGCVKAKVEISREINTNEAITIPISLSGTAKNGIDYSGVPTSITLEPGEKNKEFIINVLKDNEPEELETLTLEFSLKDPCGNIVPYYIPLFIEDIDPLSVKINNKEVNCLGDELTLTTEVIGGLPPYVFLWNTYETANSIKVSPSLTANYWVKVNDACSGISAFDTVLVEIPKYVPLTVLASSDVIEICPFKTKKLDSKASGGTGKYSYQWFESGQVVGIADSLIVNPGMSTTYVLRVTDNCGKIAFDTVNYTVTSPPLIVEPSPNVEICPGDSTFISVSASGGYGNYNFDWVHSEDTTSGIWVRPDRTTTYNVQVSDACQTFSVPAFVVVKIVKPEADFIPISQNLTEDLPITFYNLTTNAYSYDWYFSDGGRSSLVNPTHTFDTAGTYFITLIAEGLNGCLDTVIKPITILKEYYIYIPNAFIPIYGNRYNSHFSGSFIGVKWIKMEVFDRWGERVYYTEDLNFKWDGNYQNNPVQPGVYVWKLTFKSNRGMEEFLTGHVSVLR
jgi:gliding motility-associated-like protein